MTDGEGLKNLMVNLATGLKAFDPVHLIALAAIMGAGAAVGPKKAATAALGMTAIGLGIGGFFAGIAGYGTLAELVRIKPISVGVSGTHGKTTTCSLIGSILHNAKKDPTIAPKWSKMGPKMTPQMSRMGPTWGQNCQDGLNMAKNGP